MYLKSVLVPPYQLLTLSLISSHSPVILLFIIYTFCSCPSIALETNLRCIARFWILFKAYCFLQSFNSFESRLDMSLSRQKAQILKNDEADSTSDDDTDNLFEESDDNTDDEERHPPEHYLSEAANLDVARLWQKRHSPRTQERLDWV
jgi:hypothetical protein